MIFTCSTIIEYLHLLLADSTDREKNEMLTNPKISWLMVSLHDGGHINVESMIVENVKTGSMGIDDNLMFGILPSSLETQAISDSGKGGNALFGNAKHRLSLYINEDAVMRYDANGFHRFLNNFDSIDNFRISRSEKAA